MKTSEARLLLGSAALLSVEQAAELLPIRDSEARKLIEEAGIVRRLAGRRVVRWADCVDLAVPERSAGAPSRGSVRQLRRGGR